MSRAYVMTRDRIGFLPKILKAWAAQEMPLTLVVDPLDYEEHSDWLYQKNSHYEVDLIALDKSNQGVGYIRQQIVELAGWEDCESFIMSDDDIIPDPKSDMRGLTDAVLKDKLGIGATCSYYGLMMGNEKNKSGQTVLCTSGWGNRIFALNVNAAIQIGNFNPDLTCSQEDTELRREGIEKLGVGWYVDTSVNSKSIGSRYVAGGISSMPGMALKSDRLEGEQRCHKIIYDRWGPRYITEPDKVYRCKWRNFFNDYLPGWEAEV